MAKSEKELTPGNRVTLKGVDYEDGQEWFEVVGTGGILQRLPSEPTTMIVLHADGEPFIHVFSPRSKQLGSVTYIAEYLGRIIITA